jgi:hypothetical protein
MTPENTEGSEDNLPPHLSGGSRPYQAWMDDRSVSESVSSVDSLTWQRLVEDRLDDEQYRELLVMMETTPNLWRDCALAFLEDQAIKKSLAIFRMDRRSSIANAGMPDLSSSNRASLDELPPSSPTANLVKVDGNRVQTGRGVPSATRFNFWKVGLPTLAAAAGFVLTWYSFGGIWRISNSADPGANLGSSVHQNPVVMDQESFKDYLADLSAEQRRELFVRSSEQTAGLPIQAQPVSLSPGRADGKRRFLFYRTPDGGQIIVPVDDYQFATHEFQ